MPSIANITDQTTVYHFSNYESLVHTIGRDRSQAIVWKFATGDAFSIAFGCRNNLTTFRTVVGNVTSYLDNDGMFVAQIDNLCCKLRFNMQQQLATVEMYFTEKDLRTKLYNRQLLAKGHTFLATIMKAFGDVDEAAYHKWVQACHINDIMALMMIGNETLNFMITQPGISHAIFKSYFQYLSPSIYSSVMLESAIDNIANYCKSEEILQQMTAHKIKIDKFFRDCVVMCCNRRLCL